MTSSGSSRAASPEPQPQPAEPLTRRVAELFSLGYEVLLQVQTRFFTHTDETDEQLDVLVHAAHGVMVGVLRPLGTALARLPMGPGNPGRTAGAAFQMRGAIRGAISGMIGKTTVTEKLSDLEPPYGIEP